MHFIHLGMFSGDHPHPGSDRCAVTLRADQFDLDPVLVLPPSLRSREGGSFIFKISDVDVAIVVVVSKSRAAAGKMFGDARPHLG